MSQKKRMVHEIKRADLYALIYPAVVVIGYSIHARSQKSNNGRIDVLYVSASTAWPSRFEGFVLYVNKQVSRKKKEKVSVDML